MVKNGSSSSKIRNRTGCLVSLLFLFLSFYLFLERGEGREKERERNISVWLPLTWPTLRMWTATQACALTGNRTGGPLVCSPCSVHWATPGRANFTTLNQHSTRSPFYNVLKSLSKLYKYFNTILFLTFNFKIHVRLWYQLGIK